VCVCRRHVVRERSNESAPRREFCRFVGDFESELSRGHARRTPRAQMRTANVHEQDVRTGTTTVEVCASSVRFPPLEYDRSSSDVLKFLPFPRWSLFMNFFIDLNATGWGVIRFDRA